MSLAVRVIPCLDVDAGRVVKGINFKDLRDAGDPVELARTYDAEGADELTFLDISASHEGRATTMEIVSRTAEEVFIPLTVGGGVPQRRRRRPAAAGRRRQGRGQHRGDPPARAGRRDRRPVRQPGAGAVGRRPPGAGAPQSGFEVTTHGGRQSAGLDAIEWAVAGRRARRRRDPAQRDGRRRHQGRLRPRADPRGPREVTIPVIACGGAGAVEHFPPAVEAGADAVLAATVFHFGTLRIADVKAALANAGHPVR